MTERDAGPPVGVVPAAGHAMRIAPLPCSKELFPIGFYHRGRDASPRPKPVCHYLFEQMVAAGAERAFVVVDDGKWDIPAALRDGNGVGLRIGYLVTVQSPGPATTVAQAAPFVADDLVLFGFPDIVSEPVDVFARLLDRQALSGADIVLGLFVADQPEKVDMVDVDADGAVRRIDIKPARTDLTLTWINAVWTAGFTDFFSRYMDDRVGAGSPAVVDVGQVVQAAIDAGHAVDSVAFPGGSYIDIGTPEDLVRAVRLFASRDASA